MCRRRRPKESLLRMARSPGGGVAVDRGATASGRGAYICRDEASCRAVGREHLGRALRVRLGDEDLARLTAEIEQELA